MKPVYTTTTAIYNYFRDRKLVLSKVTVKCLPLLNCIQSAYILAFIQPTSILAFNKAASHPQ